MQNLTTKHTEMFCPRCGGKDELDSPEVKFCRFCGLSITESRDAVQGLTLIKRQGRRFTTWGFLTLQILFLVIFLFFIPNLPLGISVSFVIIFALSNGFFIAGNLAAENLSAPLPDSRTIKHLTQNYPRREEGSGKERQSITENTTRKLI